MTDTKMQEMGVEYIFRAYMVREDGTVVYPKNRRCLRIPIRHRD